MEDKIGRALLDKGIISQEQLDRALDYQRSIGGKLGTILVKLRFVKEDQLANLLADQQDLSSVRLQDIEITKELMDLIPREIIEKHEVLPIKRDGGTLTVAMPDPTDFPTIEEVRFVTGLSIEAVLITRTDAQKAISQHYYSADDSAGAGAAKRSRSAMHDVAREMSGKAKAPPSGPGAVEDIDAPPAKLMKVIASMLVEQGVLDHEELKRRAES